MTPLKITMNLDTDPWTDLDVADLTHNGGALLIERVGVLPQGMTSGRAIVAFLIHLPDGTPVIAETSLRLFRMAALAVLNSPVAQLDEP